MRRVYQVCIITGVLFLSNCKKNKNTAPSTGDVVVSTLAGSKQDGYANGSGAMAKFYYVYGIVVDSKDDIYVSDEFNYSIRKITSEGVVTTFAGNGAPGFNNGTGITATFRYPNGLAIDAADNIFVADQRNHCIRKINISASVSTIAGGPAEGFINGTSAVAKFRFPRGVTIDLANNIYVADAGNQCIRKISPSGDVNTFAGSGDKGFADGKGTLAQFDYPSGIVADKHGNLFVADPGNHCIRKITSAGVVSTIAGSRVAGFADGNGSSAQFNSPGGLTIDASGNILVADTENHCIRKITPSGRVTTIAGRPKFGYEDDLGTFARFSGPTGVAVDSKGIIYVADNRNNCIRKISPK